MTQIAGSLPPQPSVRNIESKTRKHILEATGELLIERGSADISLSDIARQSGMASAMVKYHFGNKSGLLMAILRRALGPSMTQLEHLKTMALKPQIKMRIHISGMINSYFHYPYVARLMHQLVVDDPDQYGMIIAEEFARPVADLQKAILEEGWAAGCFCKVDPMLFYFQVVGACDHLFYGRHQLRSVFGVASIDDELRRRYTDHLTSTLLNGILIPSAEPPG